MRVDITKSLSNEELGRPVKEYLSHFEYVFIYDAQVKDILAYLQKKKPDKRIDRIYVTDKEGVLMGSLPFRELLYNKPETMMLDIIDAEVVKVVENDVLEKALKILAHHKILFLPVVNSENKFIGILEITPHTYSAKTERKRHQTTEDIFQFIGFSIEEGKYKSSFTEFRYRMPWLLFNLFAGLTCAVIGEVFKRTLELYVILALFIPLVLTLSESIGIQSMTFSLRFLHFRKVHWSQVWQRILTEWKTSILLALGCAILLSLFYFTWSAQFMPIVAITVSMLIAMMSSAFLGALFPIIIHALSLDPKVAAGPIVLMVADIITFTIYLGLSTWILV